MFLRLFRNEYTISKEFVDRIKMLPSSTACGILDTIAAGRKYIPDPMSYLATADTTYKGAYRIDSDRDLPAYCKRIQRCLITPTAVLLMSPSIDVTNRVIRHFIRYLDRFLRVTCLPPFQIDLTVQLRMKIRQRFNPLQTENNLTRFIHESTGL